MNTSERRIEDFEEDFHVFGDVIVYCASHMRPHRTGWCSVPPDNKTPLDVEHLGPEAFDECRKKGYPLYGETPNTKGPLT